MAEGIDKYECYECHQTGIKKFLIMNINIFNKNYVF